MIHGTQDYFRECERFERRVSGLTLAVACAMLGALWLMTVVPPLRQFLNEPFRNPERFGFEGPERFVRRVQIQSEGDQAGARRKPMNRVVIPETRKGGGSGEGRSRSPYAPPAPHRGEIGMGDASTDALAQALRRAGGVPVFQSTDLVIEVLVRPEYPPEARDRGVEGRVAVMALVDTVGRVVDVQLLGGDEDGPLERASSEAVLHCRFKPYRAGGAAREVYAVFRFAFRLY